VPPSLSGGQGNLIVRAGEAVSLSYKVQGTPTPAIQWEHSNKLVSQSARVKITSDGSNMLLTIPDMGCHDEGCYTCTALNSLGSTSTQSYAVHFSMYDRMCFPQINLFHHLILLASHLVVTLL